MINASFGIKTIQSKSELVALLFVGVRSLCNGGMPLNGPTDAAFKVEMSKLPMTGRNIVLVGFPN